MFGGQDFVSDGMSIKRMLYSNPLHVYKEVRPKKAYIGLQLSPAVVKTVKRQSNYLDKRGDDPALKPEINNTDSKHPRLLHPISCPELSSRWFAPGRRGKSPIASEMSIKMQSFTPALYARKGSTIMHCLQLQKVSFLTLAIFRNTKYEIRTLGTNV